MLGSLRGDYILYYIVSAENDTTRVQRETDIKVDAHGTTRRRRFTVCEQTVTHIHEAQPYHTARIAARAVYGHYVSFSGTANYCYTRAYLSLAQPSPRIVATRNLYIPLSLLRISHFNQTPGAP